MPKLLLGYFKTYLLWCIGLIALIVAQGCVQLFGLTQEMKRIVDQGIQTGDMNYIIHSGIRMLVFTALVAVCGTGIAWLGARISCGIRKDLMRDCYKKILEMAVIPCCRMRRRYTADIFWSLPTGTAKRRWNSC